MTSKEIQEKISDLQREWDEIDGERAGLESHMRVLRREIEQLENELDEALNKEAA